ncbi:P-loop containing nucleoside triphosphate hydrolase protein [Zopfochytrium polystomum]|nr:P-loop containing nucleoside triphosphate hydrolase protein [Zopfochytrium polystomum]
MFQSRSDPTPSQPPRHRNDRIDILVLGDRRSGRTHLSTRFVYGVFAGRRYDKAGLDFYYKQVAVERPAGTVWRVGLHIYPPVGPFGITPPVLYRRADGVVFVFDTTSRASLDRLSVHVQELAQHAAGDVRKVLVGSKADLEEREVAREEAQDYADRLNIPYFEVSAKTGENVDQPFITLVEMIVDRIAAGASAGNERDVIRLNDCTEPEQIPRSGCWGG